MTTLTTPLSSAGQSRRSGSGRRSSCRVDGRCGRRRPASTQPVICGPVRGTGAGLIEPHDVVGAEVGRLEHDERGRPIAAEIPRPTGELDLVEARVREAPEAGSGCSGVPSRGVGAAALVGGRDARLELRVPRRRPGPRMGSPPSDRTTPTAAPPPQLATTEAATRDAMNSTPNSRRRGRRYRWVTVQA